MSKPKVLTLILALLALTTLACGSFAPRPESAALDWPTWTPVVSTSTPTRTPRPQALAPTSTQTVVSPTPEATLTPVPPGNVAIGQQARIVALTGINVRSEPSAQAALVGRYGAGVLVQVLDGPVWADEYAWWRVDDGRGRSGWVAAGDATDVWVTGDVGDPRPVNRAVRLGDRVSVGVRAGLALSLRYEPSQSALVVRRVDAGTQLDVVEGPIDAENYRWWKVQRDDGLAGWAAEGDGETRWLLPIE